MTFGGRGAGQALTGPDMRRAGRRNTDDGPPRAWDGSTPYRQVHTTLRRGFHTFFFITGRDQVTLSS